MSYGYAQALMPILPMDQILTHETNTSSTLWNTNAAGLKKIGIRPPEPQTIYQKPPVPANSNLSTAGIVGNFSNTVVPNKENNYELWKIQSQREPYAVDYLVNKYGGLQTRSGTMKGR
jgi:hypothetical protein